MCDILDITKFEYIDILKNRRKHVSSKIDDDALLKRVKYKKKRFNSFSNYQRVKFFMNQVSKAYQMHFLKIFIKRIKPN